MMRWPIALADMTLRDLDSQKGSPVETDVLLVVGAVALIVLLLLVWVIAIRKPRRRHHHRHHHSHHWGMNPDTEAAPPEAEDGKPLETRRRRRRREHRHRNPTLAETGGLPPMRGEKPSGGSPP